MSQPIGKKRIHELETLSGGTAGAFVLLSKDEKEYKLGVEALKSESLGIASGTPFSKMTFQKDATTFQIQPYSDYDTYETAISKGTISEVTRGSFVVRVGNTPVGEKVTITITRNGVPHEFEVTVSGPRITTPVWTIPANGGITGPAPSFSIAGYQVYPYVSNGSQQTAASWEISTVEDFSTTVFQSLNDETNKTTLTVPADTLQSGQSYYARVRFHNSVTESEWSTIQFTISESFIQRPTLIEPTSDMVLSASNIVLKADAFKWVGDEPADTHISTDWEVVDDHYDFSEYVRFSSLEDTENLTSIKLSSDYFYSQQNYRARVRYRGAKSVSEWSEPLTFRVSRGNLPNNEFQNLSGSSYPGRSIGAELACNNDGTLFATTTVAQRDKFLLLFKKGFPSYTEAGRLATAADVDAERDGRCPIAMSGDGKIIAVGVSASKANENHGEVLIYRNPSDAEWNTISGVTLAGLPADGFHGLSVKMSNDGERLIVGNGTKTLSMYSNSDQYATRTEVTPTLSADDATCGGIGAIALSEDGNGMVLGETNGTKFHVLAWEGDNWVTKASITPKDLTEKATIKVAASADLMYILVSVVEKHKYFVYKKFRDSWTLFQTIDHTELDYSISSTRYASGDVNVAPSGSWLLFGMIGTLGSMFLLRNGVYQRNNSIYGNTINNPENYHFYTSSAISKQNDLFVGADVKEDYGFFSQVKIYI